METLRKRVDVVHHRREKSEVGLLAPFADFAHEIEHAVQDRGERAMLVADDRYRLHLEPLTTHRCFRERDRSAPRVARLDLDQFRRRAAAALEPDQGKGERAVKQWVPWTDQPDRGSP